jgi:hypothetical protein
MAIGNVTEATQLPLLWQSAPAVSTDTNSTYVDTGVDGISLLVKQRMPYFVVAQQSPYIILALNTRGLVPHGISASGSSVFVGLGDGLMRNAGLPTAAIFNDAPPYLALSANANVRAVNEFVWTTFNPNWVAPNFNGPTDVQGVKIVTILKVRYVIYYVKTNGRPRLVIYSTANPISAPLVLFFDSYYGDSGPGHSYFMCVSTDQNTIFFNHSQNGHLVLHALQINPLLDLGFVFLNDVNWSQIEVVADPPLKQQLTAVCSGNYNSAPTFYIAGNAAQNLATCTVNFTTATAGPLTITNGVAFVDGDMTGTLASYSTTSATLFVKPPNSINFTQVTTPFPIQATTQRCGFIVASPNVILTCETVASANTLWRNSVGTSPWYSTVQLYNNVFNMSDFGAPSLNSTWNPQPTWYLGSTPVPIQPLPVVPYSASSVHLKYRLTVTQTSSMDPDFGSVSFPTIRAATLTRSNDFLILTHASKIRLFDDSNIQALDALGNVTWQNNMHDNVSSSSTFTEIGTTRPGVSSNGTYMTVFDHTAHLFYIYYYPFNNILFRTYGQTSDQIFNSSLISQSNYCFDNLETNPNDPHNAKFSDLNCSCIGGQRLFDAIFVDPSLMPAAQRALLLANLPCILLDCSLAVSTNPPSNVGRFMEGRCKVPITICSTTIRVENEASIGSAGIVQNCGAQPTPPCQTSIECPVGTVCKNSQCIAACATNEDCTKFGLVGYECQHGACFNPNPNAGSLSPGAIAGIVVGSVVAATLIAVLGWYFGSYRKTHPIKPKAKS